MKIIKRIIISRTIGRQAALLLFAAIMLVPLETGASADEALYKGKAIRVIVPFPPGGDNDVMARLVARGLAKHVPGRPTIIVQNMPGGGGTIATNYVYNVAKPDGLTILSAASTAVVQQLVGEEGVRFDLSKFEYVGNAGPIIQVFVVRSNVPVQRINELKKPGKPVVVAGGSPSATSTVVGRVLALEGYNVNVTLGYRGHADRYRAILGGEADAAVVGWTQANTDRENLRPMLWVGEKGPDWTNLPSLEELPLSPKTKSFIKAITVPTDFGRTFVVPPGTAPERLAVLRRALEKTVADPTFRGEAEQVGMDVRWRNAQETKSGYLEVLATPPGSVSMLKKLLGIDQ